MDFPKVGTKAGHAYWVSGLTLRNSSGTAPLGTIDVRSEGFGVGDPAPSGKSTGSGVLTGGQIPALTYASQTQTWGPVPSAPVANRLHIDAHNISHVTIDAERARVNCDAQLDITSDGSINVDFVNCPYARPKAATPTFVPLTTAFKPCTAATRTHAPPLGSGSCPAQQASDHLTVGTPDSNGRMSNFAGSVRYRVLPDDVVFTVSMTDVRKRSDLSDYTGELVADQSLRITDRNNGPGEPGTVSDTSFPVTVPCTATTDTSIGSDCGISATANSLLPGAVTAGDRSIWELGKVTINDGGPDGVASTQPNTLFATQGVFAP